MKPFVLAVAVLGTEVFALHINPDPGEPSREIDTGAAVIEHAPPQRLGFHVPGRPQTDPDWEDAA